MKKAKTAIEKNKRYSDSYFQRRNGEFKLSKEIKEIIIKEKVKSLLDLGCGEGLFLEGVKREFPEIKVTGIDISPRRIKDLKRKVTGEQFYCADVCSTKLKEKFDFVHSSQVIEHVEKDSSMVEEMKRLLSKDGVLFVSSVIKKPWGIYKYRNNGKFVLDPTHEKEYKNKEEFFNLFKKDFRLIKFKIEPTKRKIFGITIKIPGFYQIEGIWKRRA